MLFGRFPHDGSFQHKIFKAGWQREASGRSLVFRREKTRLPSAAADGTLAPMNVTVAISGGTDSLFALLSLKEQGYGVTALHARFLSGPEDESLLSDMEALCGRLGIALHVVDLSEEFRHHVMEPFALAHAAARTPNPCALCNRAMKFGSLFDRAMEWGERFATGHYVAMEEHPAYGRTLRAGRDGAKDQSYFLALVPAERLRRCLFPLAEWKKADIRVWLADRGMTPPVPAESQEICFIPNDNHYAWLEARKAEGLKLPGPGPVLLAGENRIIAQHRGLWQYTEGQRRGLGIPWKEPLYALKRLPETNTLVVGPKNMLPVTSCLAGELNLMVAPSLWPQETLVRVRYHQAPVPARVTLSEDRMNIAFLSPQQPPAPGQIAAVYDRDGFVLAGGVIKKSA